MSRNIPCYLRPLRREWGLTQKELASLIPRGRRSRVFAVEQAKTNPNAAELMAYALIFGVAPRTIFPKFVEELTDAVLRGAAKLDLKLKDDPSPLAARKRELLRQLLDRATLEAGDLAQP